MTQGVGSCYSQESITREPPPCVASLKIGYFERGGNGCGWIATYNAALLLGKSYQPADIIKYYESHGGALLDGALGINPAAVKMFFKDQGINADLHNFPSTVDERIKNARVSILAYKHSTAVHYVAVLYANGKYYVYNEFGGDTKAKDCLSMDQWAKDGDSANGGGPHTVISLITFS